MGSRIRSRQRGAFTGRSPANGFCSGASPALIHLDMIGNNFYTRTAGQIGVTSHLFSDLVSFTGPAGRELTDENGDTVTVGINQPRLGNYADLGSGLEDIGWLIDSSETENAFIPASALSDAFGGSMPVAVSIIMEGHVTYADNGLVAEAVFVDWRADGDNFLQYRLRTDGSRTGATQFLQRSPGPVEDFVITASGQYSPGTNVPFSWATRHTATELNAATEGDLLTADPAVALVDLIAANFDIVAAGRMNIRSITIIADDITDQGLDDATTEGSGFNPLCPFENGGGTPPPAQGGSFSQSFSQSFSGGV